MYTSDIKKNHNNNRLFEIKLKTPDFILFIKGFLDAKVTKNAGFDKETGLIYSPYFDGMSNKYQSYCHYRVKELEKNLYQYRENGEITILKHIGYADKLADLDSKIESTTHQYNARDMDRFKDERNEVIHRHQEDLENITKICEKIYEEEGMLFEDFYAIAKKIESMFVAYAKGMLLRHPLSNCIPRLNTSQIFDTYRSRYIDKDAAIKSYIKEASHV